MVVTPAFSENTFDGNLSVRYAITPLFSVQAGYHYTDLSSGAQVRDYSRNRVFAGVGVTF
jgi:opacity protein-like surface antigen